MTEKYILKLLIFDILFDMKRGWFVVIATRLILVFTHHPQSSEEIKGNQSTFCTAMQTVQLTGISQIQGREGGSHKNIREVFI